MPRRAVDRRRHRKVPIGDMRTKLCFLRPTTKATIDGQDRSLEPVCNVFASEESLAFGKHGHAKVNIKQAATHTWRIRYNAEIVAELIVDRDGARFKILEIENLEGRNEYMKIRARELGTNEKEVTKA